MRLMSLNWRMLPMQMGTVASVYWAGIKTRPDGAPRGSNNNNP